MDAEGSVVGEGRGSPSNALRVGFDDAFRSIISEAGCRKPSSALACIRAISPAFAQGSRARGAAMWPGE